MKDLSYGGSVVAIFLIYLIGLCLYGWFNSYSCQQRWARSGLESDWGVSKGCVVKIPGGRWLPESVVRETDLAGAR